MSLGSELTSSRQGFRAKARRFLPGLGHPNMWIYDRKNRLARLMDFVV
jgi:hypothetical protein